MPFCVLYIIYYAYTWRKNKLILNVSNRLFSVYLISYQVYMSSRRNEIKVAINRKVFLSQAIPLLAQKQFIFNRFISCHQSHNLLYKGRILFVAFLNCLRFIPPHTQFVHNVVGSLSVSTYLYNTLFVPS